MCLLVADRVPDAERSRRFKGFGFADAAVTVDSEICELCHNRCNLSLIRAGDGDGGGNGETLAWGLKCGRDYGETKPKAVRAEGYDWWRKRDAAWAKPAAKPKSARPKIGILRSLGTYGYWPYWKAFFEALNFEVVLSPRTTDATFREGLAVTMAEYCAPVVAGLGHFRALLDAKVDWVFAPHQLREPTAPGFTDAHFCPYVQAHPGVLRAIQGAEEARILSPVVQFGRSRSYQVDRLWEALAEPLGLHDRGAVALAIDAAEREMAEFAATSLALGREAEACIEANNTLGLVAMGRPYNTVDPGLTLDLPRKMAELGYPVLYQDMLPYDLSSILPEQANMYWHSGQKILATAAYVASHPRLFGVFFTNFMCGPDSYIMTYFKEIMGKSGKPYLCLQFDGHGADAGYLTRVEAALESFHSWSGIPRK